MSTQSPPVAVAVLDSAVAYAHVALDHARSSPLNLPTPCAEWDLGHLLLHMEDSLAAIGEAASLGYVEVVDHPRLAPADRLVDRVVQRACRTRAAWVERITSAPIAVGDRQLARDDLLLVGSLEIAVHGWDVGRATGHGSTIPASLALPLLDVAQEVVGGDDRRHRFAPPRFLPATATPSARLLGFLGRG